MKKIIIERKMNYKTYVKEQVSEKDWKKLKELEVILDSDALASLWPDFVSFKRRKSKETPFLISQLKEYGRSKKIFDACLGSGATTIGLKNLGIEKIISNEIDEYMVKAAVNEAIMNGNVSLNIKNYDWRELNKQDLKGFNAVLCLGNSLTYLFKKEDQLKAVTNFKDILKPNGKLIIDERNYAGQILKGEYKHSGKYVYCGKDKVFANPIFTSNRMVVMEYESKNTREKAHLVLYPFKAGEMKGLLEKAGFEDIEVFGDYKKGFNPAEAEFITYVCRKK